MVESEGFGAYTDFGNLRSAIVGNVTGWCVDEKEITVTKAFECSGEYFMSRSRNDAERAQEKVPGFLLCKRYFVACDGC